MPPFPATDATAIPPSAETQGYVLREYMGSFSEILADPLVSEIAINRPYEVYVEKEGQWISMHMPELSYKRLVLLANLIASFSKQSLGRSSPYLSGSLPTGERVQVVVEPAVEPGTVSFTIRKPVSKSMSLEEMSKQGLFARLHQTAFTSQDNDELLLTLLNTGQYVEFFKQAVKLRKNILVSGATGSGKTTFARALANLIPLHERIITLEDVRELDLPHHNNRVHLLYGDNEATDKGLNAKSMLRACLRMKPDRILLSEIRSKVAYDFIVNASSGHPGTISTIHAGSALETFEMLMLRIKESEESAHFSINDIMQILIEKLDIIVHVGVFPGEQENGPKTRLIDSFYFKGRDSHALAAKYL